MEDLYEDEALGGPPSPEPDGGQPPHHFNGGSGKSVSLRILSMPSSPLPAASSPGRTLHSPGHTMPSSPVSAVSLSVATGSDSRRRSARDRASRKGPSKLNTVPAGGTTEGSNSAPSVGVNAGEGCLEVGTPSATATPVVPKKSRVDFVRFDSTEIHYTENDEVRKKISDEIKR
ncbi:hypothetical protein ZHAS_00016648 [Anopheles sinensis]|uniref:Uncharacterized protein n=1 Tax=Anopheles sinensis TaxID=74873 RepID=A0A084WEL0_ANOSI|nr:hypothetical protein ZHAS_00016648 [Anopheles sinensis]